MILQSVLSGKISFMKTEKMRHVNREDSVLIKFPYPEFDGESVMKSSTVGEKPYKVLLALGSRGPSPFHRESPVDPGITGQLFFFKICYCPNLPLFHKSIPKFVWGGGGGGGVIWRSHAR